MGKLSETRGKPDFWVNPKGASNCVVVFHEVWGLVEHTKDVCKRVGKLGFAAVAPNLYSGYDDILVPDKIQKTMEGVWALSLEERRDKQKVAEALAKKGVGDDIRQVAAVLYDQAFRDRLLNIAVSKVEEAHSDYDGVTTFGFCLGGGLALKSASKTGHLKSAMCFYGEPPISEDVPKIAVPVLGVYASDDEIINGKVPGFVGAMIEHNKDLTLKTFPRTKHGFFNDTRKEVYNRNAASDSWEIAKWFLARTLGS